ncbi:hypothetical protein [Streptomyces misionensis]|uniref:hypothetical protein n=1 Tax=Streptomyces misionensis TaxID=67331 RepID=UPI003673A856
MAELPTPETAAFAQWLRTLVDGRPRRELQDACRVDDAVWEQYLGGRLLPGPGEGDELVRVLVDRCVTDPRQRERAYGEGTAWLRRAWEAEHGRPPVTMPEPPPYPPLPAAPPRPPSLPPQPGPRRRQRCLLSIGYIAAPLGYCLYVIETHDGQWGHLPALGVLWWALTLGGLAAGVRLVSSTPPATGARRRAVACTVWCGAWLLYCYLFYRDQVSWLPGFGP